jgi:hypothetical protein
MDADFAGAVLELGLLLFCEAAVLFLLALWVRGRSRC